MSKRFIAALGGSAGSLQALKEFFDHTPHDDVSFVILQHLPADFISQLKIILGRRTSLKIIGIENDMAVEKDIIYIAPPGKYTKIINNRFFTTPRQDRINHSADVFMTSLAKHSGIKSIAVILSGVLNDGSEGVKKVKTAGGLTIAQDPATCQFKDMPANAINTGCISKVMTCDKMGALIHLYVETVKKSTGETED